MNEERHSNILVNPGMNTLVWKLGKRGTEEGNLAIYLILEMSLNRDIFDIQFVVCYMGLSQESQEVYYINLLPTNFW